MAIVKALGSNSTLGELKIDNQVSHSDDTKMVIHYQMLFSSISVEIVKMT